MKIAAVAMALLFGLSAAVQFNDPDPLAWVAVYGAAALAGALFAAGRRMAPLAAIVALAAAGWAAMLAGRVVGEVPLADVFTSMRMGSRGIEEARELGGLVIVAVWMIVLIVVERRRRPGDA